MISCPLLDLIILKDVTMEGYRLLAVSWIVTNVSKVSPASIFKAHGVTNRKTVILTFSTVRISRFREIYCSHTRRYGDYDNLLSCETV